LENPILKQAVMSTRSEEIMEGKENSIFKFTNSSSEKVNSSPSGKTVKKCSTYIHSAQFCYLK
jgi:hypothetical protein